jgi:hypothetical protein
MVKSDSEHASEVDTALLDAELFVKYKAPERAIKRLRTALERNPRSIPLRERLREVAAAHKHADEAARQALALASLYIEREDFDSAYDRLLEAKQLDARINIASGLDAIRRARRPQSTTTEAAPATPIVTNASLAGNLSDVSVFDAVQVIENSKLSGVLTITGDLQNGEVFFNDGRIVGAAAGGAIAEEAFACIVEITSGAFEFQKRLEPFPVTIKATSNTNLLLDTLRQLDEGKA